MSAFLKLTRSTVRSWVPPRRPETHKGDYGHVLVLAGSRGMSGAGALCASGALRGGSGLVTIGLPESQQAIVAKKARPEAMTFALPESSRGALSVRAVSAVVGRIKKRKMTSLVVGPGLSRNSEAQQFVKKLLIELNKDSFGIQGIVLDADGFLALKPDKKKSFLSAGNALPVIVTPHEGELASFCDVSTATLRKDRVNFARKFAKLYRVVCVLKGHRTVISDGEKVFMNVTGNPGMATGGSGDVLAGLIAALIPQIAKSKEQRAESKSGVFLSPILRPILLQAACVGVYIHGLAGDFAKKEKTEIGMLAGDIAEEIPRAFKAVMGG